MWNCKQCGAANSDNANYCSNCGSENHVKANTREGEKNTSKIKAIRNVLILTVLVIMIASLFCIYFYKNSIYGYYLSESNVYSVSLNWDGSCYWYQNDTRFEGRFERNGQDYTLFVDGKSHYSDTVFSVTREGRDLRIIGGTVDNELFVKESKPSSIKALDEYGDWTVVKQATCLEAGLEQRVSRNNPENGVICTRNG